MSVTLCCRCQDILQRWNLPSTPVGTPPLDGLCLDSSSLDDSYLGEMVLSDSAGPTLGFFFRQHHQSYHDLEIAVLSGCYICTSYIKPALRQSDLSTSLQLSLYLEFSVELVENNHSVRNDTGDGNPPCTTIVHLRATSADTNAARSEIILSLNFEQITRKRIPSAQCHSLFFNT
jgi:hypothetical protein